MRKYLLFFIIFISTFNVYAIETPNVLISRISPNTIKSYGKDVFVFYVYNGENKILHDLEISFVESDILEVRFEGIKINSLEKYKSVNFNIEIINKNSYYFRKDSFILLRVSNNDFTKDFNFKIIIEPKINFWLLIIISFVSLLITAFIIVFMKINKEE